MSTMFGFCTNFDQPLNSWVPSSVTNMQAMFGSCSNFDQNIDSWIVSAVLNMSIYV
jgi:surface protein